MHTRRRTLRSQMHRELKRVCVTVIHNCAVAPPIESRHWFVTAQAAFVAQIALLVQLMGPDEARSVHPDAVTLSRWTWGELGRIYDQHPRRMEA